MVLTWSEEGLGKYFLTGRKVFAKVGAWWDLLLVQNYAWDKALEAKVKSDKADTTLECEEHEEVTFEEENVDSSLDSREGARMFVLVFITFLGVEGWAS